MNKEFSGMEKVSLVDYDNKISCTLFTNGCNFRCPFCHNAPLVIGENNDIIKFDEIIDYLEKRKNRIQAVVITGGEPTMLINLVDKIRKIKSLGYLIKLDTNGSNLKMIKDLVELHLVDYIAMDIKNSENSYLKTIGLKRFDLNRIKESIAYIMSCGVQYEFRTTLVKEFHTKDDMIEIAQLIKGCKKYFLQRFVSRVTCINPHLNEVSIEEAKEYQKIFLERGINCLLRSY